MTVAEIKKYIDKWLEWWNRQEERPKKRLYAVAIKELNEIKDMLDELDDRPKAKWTNNMNGTFTCSRCGAKRPNDNYCGNCGAIMREPKENKV